MYDALTNGAKESIHGKANDKFEGIVGILVFPQTIFELLAFNCKKTFYHYQVHFSSLEKLLVVVLDVEW